MVHEYLSKQIRPQRFKDEVPEIGQTRFNVPGVRGASRGHTHPSKFPFGLEHDYDFSFVLGQILA